MKALVNILFFLSLTMGVYAHQPDVSTSLLSKTKDGHYVLQVVSALTAFEGEIDYIYSKESYATSDEFKELVITHFKNNVRFIVNGDDTLNFINPLVILGHETKLVVEVESIPETIKSFRFSNTMFKDMPHNKMGLMFLIDGFPEEQLILDNDNEQVVEMAELEGEWQLVEPIATQDKGIFFRIVAYVLLATIILVLGLILRKKLS